MREVNDDDKYCTMSARWKEMHEMIERERKAQRRKEWWSTIKEFLYYFSLFTPTI